MLDDVESMGRIVVERGSQVGNVVRAIMEGAMFSVAASKTEDSSSDAVVFVAGDGEVRLKLGEYRWWRYDVWRSRFFSKEGVCGCLWKAGADFCPSSTMTRRAHT